MHTPARPPTHTPSVPTRQPRPRLPPSAVVFIAIVCNITLTPALLLSFECLSHFDLLPSRR